MVAGSTINRNLAFRSLVKKDADINKFQINIRFLIPILCRLLTDEEYRLATIEYILWKYQHGVNLFVHTYNFYPSAISHEVLMIRKRSPERRRIPERITNGLISIYEKESKDFSGKTDLSGFGFNKMRIGDQCKFFVTLLKVFRWRKKFDLIFSLRESFKDSASEWERQIIAVIDQLLLQDKQKKQSSMNDGCISSAHQALSENPDLLQRLPQSASYSGLSAGQVADTYGSAAAYCHRSASLLPAGIDDWFKISWLTNGFVDWISVSLMAYQGVDDQEKQNLIDRFININRIKNYFSLINPEPRNRIQITLFELVYNTSHIITRLCKYDHIAKHIDDAYSFCKTSDINEGDKLYRLARIQIQLVLSSKSKIDFLLSKSNSSTFRPVKLQEQIKKHGVYITELRRLKENEKKEKISYLDYRYDLSHYNLDEKQIKFQEIIYRRYELEIQKKCGLKLFNEEQQDKQLLCAEPLSTEPTPVRKPGFCEGSLAEISSVFSLLQEKPTVPSQTWYNAAACGESERESKLLDNIKELDHLIDLYSESANGQKDQEMSPWISLEKCRWFYLFDDNENAIEILKRTYFQPKIAVSVVYLCNEMGVYDMALKILAPIIIKKQQQSEKQDSYPQLEILLLLKAEVLYCRAEDCSSGEKEHKSKVSDLDEATEIVANYLKDKAGLENQAGFLMHIFQKMNKLKVAYSDFEKKFLPFLLSKKVPTGSWTALIIHFHNIHKEIGVEPSKEKAKAVKKVNGGKKPIRANYSK